MKLLAVLLALIVVTSSAGAVVAQDAVASPDILAESGDAAARYCTDVGGIVRTRVPVYGTNLDEAQRIVLGGERSFCEFTGETDADPGSWISISLDTLTTELPTLATVAYLTKAPVPEVTGGANPSAVHCVALGGAYDFGGAGFSGGGWVTTDPEPALTVLNFCVFADGSMIDAWGITYHSNGVTRGADLAPKLRYQPDEGTIPRLFG